MAQTSQTYRGKKQMLVTSNPGKKKPYACYQQNLLLFPQRIYSFSGRSTLFLSHFEFASANALNLVLSMSFATVKRFKMQSRDICMTLLPLKGNTVMEVYSVCFLGIAECF